MKAIILAAGKGTRVRPITYTIPKPMIPILNKPVMETLVALLREHGVRQIMVNTSYLSMEIERYFRDGARFGVEMAYSFEGRLEDGALVDEPMGSAGALKKIQAHSGFFDQTFAVLCGDAMIDIDLTALLRFHREKGAMVTIALADVPRRQVSSYGVVVTDSAGRIVEFQEKPPVEEARSTTVNTGIYIFEPDVLEMIPSGVAYDIGGELFPKLAEEGKGLYGATIPFQWLDIGQVGDYYRVIQMALKGDIHGLKAPGTEVAPGIWFGLNVRADVSACDITPPVYVGGSATLEPGCRIAGPTMIGPGCVVESGACVEKSVVFDYTRIGASAELREMMICGGYAVDASGTVIDLAKSAIDWVISDARSPKQELSADQQQFLDMLLKWKVSESER